jgi:hypothetical protein
VPRFLSFLVDGVTYLTGHRDAVDHIEPTDLEPGQASATAALQAFLTALEGLDRRLRAGFAVVRWADGDDAPRAWSGPAYLFSFEARTAGTFETTFAGEDPALDWPPPS